MKRLYCEVHNRNGRACLEDSSVGCKIIEEDNFVPPDCKEQTARWLIGQGGCCGQACLAVIERSSIDQVFKRWKALGLDWKGYTSVNQLRDYLKKRGFKVKLITTKNKTDFQAPFYIYRIQWLGPGEKKEKPFYGYNHWSQASIYTHFIMSEKDKRFFCNENGWMDLADLNVYLGPRGIITSLYEVNK